MSLHETTPVPNIFFDVVMGGGLTLGEVMTLLVIIRQTYGYRDFRDPKRRKKWAWITNAFFRSRTSLSKRSITRGIEGLLKKSLIKVFDEKGNLLLKSMERSKAKKLIFQPTFVLDKTIPALGQIDTDPVDNSRIFQKYRSPFDTDRVPKRYLNKRN